MMAPSAATPSALSALLSTAWSKDSGTSPKSSPASSLPEAAPPYTALALTIKHGLEHQHYWTALTLHTHSPLDPSKPLPRPILSGLPPSRLYVHPDDQADELKHETSRHADKPGKPGRSGTAKNTASKSSADATIEREWVLPTHLRESWSLAKFAGVFDAIGEQPPDPEMLSSGTGGSADAETTSVAKNDAEQRREGALSSRKARRGGKRLLLAILSEDSAISYYVVHDGIVKPRQN